MYRSRFNLGHYHLLTGDMGKLIPVGCQFVSMGDTFNHHMTALVRMTPPAAPLMHNYFIRVHHWFVPIRILWEEYESFMTKGQSGVETPDFPQINVNGMAIGSLADYFGLPVDKITSDFYVSAIPFRAYAKIYNEFYRDQDLIPSLPISTASGVDNVTSTQIQNVSYAKDYFTTARPFTQRGPEVTIPVFSAANEVSEYEHRETQVVVSSPVSFIVPNMAPPVGDNPYNSARILFSLTVEGATLMSAAKVGVPVTLTNEVHFYCTLNLGYFNAAWAKSGAVTKELLPTLAFENRYANVENGISDAVKVVSNPWNIMNYYITDDTGSRGQAVYRLVRGEQYTVYIDSTLQASSYHTISKSSTGSITIQDTRLAEAIQKMQERRAKYGARFLDYQASYGIKGSDGRLQLPEYLTGGVHKLKISEVLQTSPYEDSGVGDLYGYGIGAGRTKRYKKFFEEHGVILTLMSIVPENVYSTAIHRDWLKTTQEEYFQYELQGIGVQEIYKGELFPVADSDKKQPWGYQGRYDEMRHTRSGIHGEFRTLYNYWHSARIFDELPTLNKSFIECNPSKRIFMEQTKHSFLIMAYHHIKALRLCAKESFTKI